MEKYLEMFRVSKEKLSEVSELLNNDFNQGLMKNTDDKMLATFIRATPDGTGNFIPVLDTVERH